MISDVGSFSCLVRGSLLGDFWVLFGRLLDHLWDTLGDLGGTLGAWGVTLGNFGTHWAHFGSIGGTLERHLADLS